MRTKFIAPILLLILTSFTASAQLGKRIKDRSKEKTESRTEDAVDRTIDKGFDKLDQGIDRIFGGKNKKSEPDDGNSYEDGGNEPDQENYEDFEDGPGSHTSTNSGTDGSTTPNLKRYTNYTFIPGEEILAFEDFSNEPIGNLPGSWVSTGTAEVVNFEGQAGKWLWFNKTNGNFIPEYLVNMPEHFTLEFDLMFDFPFGTNSFSRFFSLVFSDIPNHESKLNWEGRPSYFFLQKLADNYTAISFSAVGSNGGPFITGRKAVSKNKALNFSTDYKANDIINGSNNNTPIHIAISRSGRRLQVFANEVKVLDMTNAFEKGVNLTSARFYVYNHTEHDNYYLSNIRYAKGEPDVRNKILNNGNYVTSGITFSSGSADIKPESYAVLKEIASALKSQSGKSLTIIGHTDSDGGNDLNMKLSADRAKAVKAVLENDFGVTNSITTQGKAASEPVSVNNTAAGKAKNRRVQFQLN